MIKQRDKDQLETLKSEIAKKAKKLKKLKMQDQLIKNTLKKNIINLKSKLVAINRPKANII